MAAATTTNPKPRGSDNSNNKPPEKEITTTQPHYHTIDIRAFLLLIAVTMTASFMAGVMVLPPTPTVTLESGDPATEDGGGAEHRPSGQHLLVDIKGVDADFLNSEELLSQAMVDTVQESGLTLLSYHCHFLAPSGVSCVGILLESHSESSILFLWLE